MFRDRWGGADALADVLGGWFAERADALGQPIVLGLPRGGVPVAARVAQRLGWPWDVLIVRKIGAPDQPELAVGAVGEGGVEVRHDAMVGLFDESAVEGIAARERQRILERVAMFRRGREMIDIRDRPVVIVDDGLATGATMAAAIAVARQHGAGQVIAAAPVGSAQAVNWLQHTTDETNRPDEVICVQVPSSFMSVGQHYEDFEQVTDDDVVEMLAARP